MDYCSQACADQNDAARVQGSGASTIYFYEAGADYYEFTNFFDLSPPVKIDGMEWKTTEHYFQAMKFSHHPQLMEQVRRARSPREAFNIPRDPAMKAYIRSDWHSVKVEVMYKALLCKFMQSHTLGHLLVETRDAMLVERSPVDSYWGDGGDGSGENMLGILLMKVRSVIKNCTRKM